MPARKQRLRSLVVVLGDQLNADSAAFDGFDKKRDAVWMAEVQEESTHVWSHKVRIALFLSAMRHFRDRLQGDGATVHYRRLDDPQNAGSLGGELAAAIAKVKPERIVLVEPGEYRVRESLREVVRSAGVALEERPDRHFFCSAEEFEAHCRGRKSLRLEFFYREVRQRTGVLMDGADPEGGRWNFDPENRRAFGTKGPGLVPAPVSFPPDETTRAVLELVARRFADHPGRLDHFDWPVTPEQALVALDDFIEHRLASFGDYQDALWQDEPYLFHSRLSSAMNLKLLDPRIVVNAAETAYRKGGAPLAAVEGFIRQILGWREYVRGVYWRFMPDYLDRNALKAHEPLPEFYWTGATEMNCLRQAVGQTLDYGYAHHIQRLMVTGLYALLLGVDPRAVHEWYLAVYVDAVEWVELPNTLGMSQFADGGVMASKPYVASGKYIDRMSNYCKGCRYNPAKSTGEDACPFTTLYWDFLMRHEEVLAKNQRMVMQVRNLKRLTAEVREEIGKRAREIRGGKCPSGGGEV
jgi:deoxyribodipyrimidine photolyase-related protein